MNIYYNEVKVQMDALNVKVVKFGGSSLADAEHFKKVKEIMTEDVITTTPDIDVVYAFT